MKYSLLKTNLNSFLKQIVDSGKRLIAPLKKDEGILFSDIQDTTSIELDVLTSRSAKEFLFPQSEPIVQFIQKKDSVELYDVEPRIRDTVIFGLRPCDAASFPILDHVFSWDYEDKFYWKRRNATTLVAISCASPEESCFCTSVGLSPVSEEGSDLLLTPIDNEKYLVEIFSEKGQKLVDSSLTLFTQDSSLDKGAFEQATRAKFKRMEDLSQSSELLMKNFENPLWGKLSCQCIGCGACAMVCPTCHCFDIVDEADSRGGIRYKNWDCCSFALFTRHGAGHNPRDIQTKRCRQRYFHKLSYYKQKFGKILCVGCGRCARVCPVGLDIYSVVSTVKKESDK